MIAFKMDIRGAKRKISESRKILKGDGNRLAPAWTAGGLSLLADVRTDHVTLARLGRSDLADTDWAPISPLTRLLRKGPKVSSWQQLESEKVQIGRDTGAMLSSFTFGAPGNVFETKTMSVTVGSNVKYAQRFAAGFQSQFEVTDEIYRHVRKRVNKPLRLTRDIVVGEKRVKGRTIKDVRRQKIGGDKRQSDGQKALREFNKEIFGMLFGSSGKTFTVPARPLIPKAAKVPPAWKRRLTTIFAAALKRILHNAGLDK